MKAELIDNEADVESILPDWDSLARAAGLPAASPAWMWGSWRHLHPEGAQLRVVVVSRGAQTVAIAPYFAAPPVGARTDYRLLGSGATAGISPLAVRDTEWEAARLIASALAGARPRPQLVTFEGIPLASPWPTLLREHWPGVVRPTAWRPWVMGAPTATLAQGSFEEWLGSKSSNFRSQMKRMRRQLAKAGGAARQTTLETLDADIEAMMRLHAVRWRDKGDSGVTPVADELASLFAEAGRSGLERGAIRLQVIEVDGEPISVQAFVASGGVVDYWNGGWDERFAKLKPSMLGLVAAIEDAFGRGDHRFTFGAGTQHYKLRLADGVEPIAWGHLIVPGARAPATFAQLTPQALGTAARRVARRGLSSGQQERLKALRRKLPV